MSPYTPEINKLSIGPSTLDFGTVSALSTTTKYFAVTNELKAVLMQLPRHRTRDSRFLFERHVSTSSQTNQTLVS